MRQAFETWFELDRDLQEENAWTRSILTFFDSVFGFEPAVVSA